jgi:hypothetical protein
MTEIFRNKLPADEVVLEFNFADKLPAGVTLTDTAIVVAVSVSAYGPPATETDPEPSAIINGEPALDPTETQVLQPVKGGVPGVRYLFDVQCGTTSGVWEVETQAILPVGY